MSDGVVLVEAGVSQSGSAKLPVIPLVLAVLVAVVTSVVSLGGLGVWLVRSGRLPVTGSPKEQVAVKAEPVKTRLITLDPLLVNLADEGGHAYLRVGIVLREEEPQVPKGEKAKEEKPEKGKVAVSESDVLLRDAALGVIGRETAAGLLAGDGKERLKATLQKTMQERAPEAKLLDVLFTEFLVQR